MARLIHFDNFRGFATNTDKGDLPQELGTKMQNMRPKGFGGGMEGLAGNKLFANGPALLAGGLNYFKEVVVNNQQILIVWGLDSSSIQHFFYSTDIGVTWNEITEFAAVAVDVVTQDGTPGQVGAVFTIKQGVEPTHPPAFQNDVPSSTVDAHKNWWLFYHDVSTPANDTLDYIIGYNSTTNLVTTLDSCPGIATDDLVVLMRFPFWIFDNLQDLANETISPNFDDYRNFVRDDGNFKPTIIQRQNSVAIYTGRKKDTVNIGKENFSNIHFGHVTLLSNQLFNDGDLAFTGFHAERKNLDAPNDGNLISSFVGAANTVDPVPDNKIWGLKLSLIYDGFQETSVFWDNEHYLNATTQIRDLSASTNQQLDVTLSWDRFTTNADMLLQHGSRRITAVRAYLCELTSVTATIFKPDTPFFFVKEIKIQTAVAETQPWSGSNAPYTTSFSILGSDFEVGKRFEAELVHGHFSEIRVNADLVETVDGREVGASLVAGEKTENLVTAGGASVKDTTEDGKSFLIYSAINLALRNTPDAMPESNIKDMSEHGIYEIFNIKRLRNKLSVFGENRLVLLRGTEESDVFDEVGVNGYWSVATKGSKLSWGNLKSIYELFDGGNPKEIGFPIRDEWQSLSINNRKTSKAVFHEENNLFVLHSPSGTTYLYDEVLQSWRTYVADRSWEWLDTGVDGELLATDKTNIYELFPVSGSTEVLTGTWEKEVDFEKTVSINAIHLMYKITGVITVKIFDLEKNTNFSIAETKFLARTQFEAEIHRISFRAKKIKIQLTVNPTTATDNDYEIDFLSLHGHQLTGTL